MTVEEAIKWLEYSKQGEIGKAVEAADMAIEALEQKTEWTPISERLPEKDDLYLGYSDDGVYELVHCFNGIFSYSGVIAWMPLPEPYKAESEGKDVNI